MRHRVTRLLRESYRLRESEFKQGFDLVVIARNMVKDEGFHTVESALLHLMKLHRLKKMMKTLKKILIYLIQFYRAHLSKLKGKGTCIYTPTCSEYAVEALEKQRRG